MLSKTMQAALNNQVKLEAASSQAYLAMASWSEIQAGLDGVAEFFFHAKRRRTPAHAETDPFHQ